MRATLVVLLAIAACGRTDVAFAPGGPIVERELVLDDGEAVWVEVHAGEDRALRASFLAVDDGVTLDGLVDAIAMDDDAQLVLDTTAEDGVPVLVVEVDAEPRAFIWR
jgi:hypothetical protein